MSPLIRFAVRHNLITPDMMRRDPLWLRVSAHAHGRLPHELEADLAWLDGIKKRAEQTVPGVGKPYRRRAEVYAMKDGKILTGLINNSFMSFGGGIDDDEDDATAAAREVEEETGYPLTNVRPLGPPVLMEFADRPIPADKMTPKQRERRAKYRGDHTQFFIADVAGEPSKAVDPSKAKNIDFRDIPTLRKILANANADDVWAKHHLERFKLVEKHLEAQRLLQQLREQIQQRLGNGSARGIPANGLVQN